MEGLPSVPGGAEVGSSSIPRRSVETQTPRASRLRAMQRQREFCRTEKQQKEEARLDERRTCPDGQQMTAWFGGGGILRRLPFLRGRRGS